MPIDSNIALGVKPVQIESPLNQMANVYALQNAQQSNQLNQLNLGEAQRKIEDRNRLRSTLGGFAKDMSVADQVNALVKGGYLDEARLLTESEAKVNKDKRESELAASTLKANSIKFHRDLLPTVRDQASYEQWGMNAIKDIPELGKMLPAQYDPALIPQLAMSADKYIEANKPQILQQNLGGKANIVSVNPYTGKQEIVSSSAMTATPGEQKPTFNQGAWYYPPTAENPQGTVAGETRADKPKPLTTLQDTKLQHDIGKDYKTTQDAIASFADVKKATAQVKSYTNAQLGKVTGKYGEYLPSLGETAKNVDTDLANLKGKVTSLGKIAASASGAIGSMAVQEWTLVRDMIAALDETKMTPEKLRQQMDLIDAQLAGAETRLRDAYATTHQEDFVRYPKRFELPPSNIAPAAAKPNAPARNPMKAQAYEAYLKAHSGDNK